MKTPKQFAENYLRFILGGRRGCRVLEDLDEKLKNEIIDELAAEIEKRDKEIIAQRPWEEYILNK